MRYIALLFFVIISTHAQKEAIFGEYKREWSGSNGESLREIVLNSDGTFIFHTYERHDGGLPPERDFYAKGTWKQDKKVISFIGDPSENYKVKFNLDFSRTKARFSTRSPRDKSNRKAPTYLLFYESDISWIKGTKLVKD